MILHFFTVFWISLYTYSKSAEVSHFWGGKVTSIEQISTLWPNQVEFNLDNFKSSNPNERSQTLLSLMQNPQIVLDKNSVEIRKLLGQWDGYYFSNTIPAYRVSAPNNDPNGSYQIVFLPNTNKKAAKLIIHKLCCY